MASTASDASSKPTCAKQPNILLEDFDAESRASLTLFDPDWHQGVIGILAGRVKEQLHRPTFAFARGHEGELKGSGRSIPGLHLRDALDLVAKRRPKLLKRFGGHAAAAGLTHRRRSTWPNSKPNSKRLRGN